MPTGKFYVRSFQMYIILQVFTILPKVINRFLLEKGERAPSWIRPCIINIPYALQFSRGLVFTVFAVWKPSAKVFIREDSD